MVESEAFDQRLQELLDFSVPVIGVQKLAEAKPGEYLILDTREQEEYDVSHIPNAVFLGYKKPDWNKLQHVSKEQPIITYCSVGYRSEKLGEDLRKRGFTQVFNLYGSIFEWANQGHVLEGTGGQPTQEVHTYNKRWSKWVQEGNGLKKVH
ncbi:MAG: rhodanese-like domain-containing protein [Saprospiraceae bacterium]|nr:rhodanese-like domain-containing protein [Saprospiraceae bacterium]